MKAMFTTAIISVIGSTAFAGAAAQESSNPMWVAGYDWQCQTSSRTTCERDGFCTSTGAKGTFHIDYENNRLDFGGVPVRIKRHYQQRIANSPLQIEVKIELADNRVLWLTAVDASYTYSNAWVGTLIEPKGGVVLMISDNAYCLPGK